MNLKEYFQVSNLYEQFDIDYVEWRRLLQYGKHNI